MRSLKARVDHLENKALEASSSGLRIITMKYGETSEQAISRADAETPIGRKQVIVVMTYEDARLM